MNGWVKFHKKILEWEWWDDLNTFRLFFYLVTSANWKDKKWKGQEIKRGQLVTGRDSLSENTGLSVQSIRTSLSKLKSTNEITIKTTNKFSLITIVNYDKYQNIEDESTNKSTNKLTNNQPTTNQQLTTTEEYKKVRSKEIKNKYNTFIKKFNEIVGTDHQGDSRSQGHFNERIKKYTLEQIETAIRNAKSNPFLMGENANKKRYLTPEYILRENKLDEWLNSKPKKNFELEDTSAKYL